MNLLSLKDNLDGLARASGVRWYGHVLRRNNGDVLRRALEFEVAGRRGRGGPNMMWKRQVEEYTNQIGLKTEDITDRVKWRNVVYELSRSTRLIRPPELMQTKPDFKKWISFSRLKLTNKLPQYFILTIELSMHESFLTIHLVF